LTRNWHAIEEEAIRRSHLRQASYIVGYTEESDQKPDTLCSPYFHGWNTNEPTIRCDGGATTVSGINGGVGLNPRQSWLRTKCRDRTYRYGALSRQPKGIAYGDNLIP
jgi:hypothetical protein